MKRKEVSGHRNRYCKSTHRYDMHCDGMIFSINSASFFCVHFVKTVNKEAPVAAISQ